MTNARPTYMSAWTAKGGVAARGSCMRCGNCNQRRSSRAGAFTTSARHPPRAEERLAELAHHARIGPRQLARHVGRLHPREHVADDVEARLVLVVGAHHHPRRLARVAAQEHLVAGTAVVAPVPLCRLVHRAQLPLLERVAAPLPEPPRLLGAADVEVVLEEVDARAHQHLLEARDRLEEGLVLGARAELHDVLDAGAVVPAAVEQHDLLGRRQMRGVALEVPLGFLAVARPAGGHHPHLARAQVLGDALDGAIFARGIAPLEDHQHLASAGDHVAMELHQLNLQPPQLARVMVLAELRDSRRRKGLFRHDLLRLSRARAWYSLGAGGYVWRSPAAGQGWSF